MRGEGRGGGRGDKREKGDETGIINTLQVATDNRTIMLQHYQ